MVQTNPITRLSLADEIRARLRELILLGDVQPGERLTEQGIAETMGTSAGPVREAFASLTAEGLLISLPHRGTFVSEVSREEALGAYQVRARLEPYAVERALPHLTPELLAELDGHLEGLATAAERGDHQGMVPHDMRFHGVFYEHAGNPVLAAIWPMLEATIRKYIAVAGPQYDRDLDDLVRKHQRILDCVRNRDLRGVKRELADHGRDLSRLLETDS